MYSLKKPDIIPKAIEYGFVACIELTINVVKDFRKQNKKQIQIHKAQEVMRSVTDNKAEVFAGYASVKRGNKIRAPRSSDFNLRMIRYNELFLNLVIEGILGSQRVTETIPASEANILSNIYNHSKKHDDDIISLISPQKKMANFLHYSKVIEDITGLDFESYKQQTHHARSQIFVKYIQQLFRSYIPRDEYFDACNNIVFISGKKERYTDIDYTIATSKDNFLRAYSKISRTDNMTSDSFNLDKIMSK